ncbi:GATA-type zinc finger protein 1 [Triplophysa rosa]|uniref:GATA-type zinc finger protein 1 n=1 Tax=Triplophysa rosa TaxID=992332 RepID=A0A9W8C529_TRIRA|nr:GATA-type zinc finger protein 1 [Triplophysa rosa]KAI7807343.1 putative GATA-type zinc finger protein 1 [Triplophysa rosa]
MSSNAQDLTEDVQHQQVTSTILYLLLEATKLTPPAGDESSSALRETSCNSHVHEDSSSDFTGSFSLVRESDSSSAWEVMRLINQQCEWLLRSGDEERTQADSAETPLNPCGDPSAVPPRAQSPSPAAIYSAQPTDHLTHVSDEEEMEEPDGLAELIMNNTEENICLSENASTLHDVSRDESHDCDSVALSTGSERTDPEICPVDFTSCLVSERDGDDLWLPIDAYESTQAHGEPADINNNRVESLHKDIQESGRRTQRKQPHPARSPDPQDPDVQGVTFSMHPEVDTSTDQCKLVITSNYSEEMRRVRRPRSGRCRAVQTSQRSSSSEEESDSCGASRGKICASCLTRKTPLWRDAEDGTPLCNACGIRYKKYGVRCHHCWSIPKKDAKSNSKCLKCGDVLRLNSQQKCGGW